MATSNPPIWTIHPETPEIDDYLRLRLAGCQSTKTSEAAAKGLPNTFYALVVRSKPDGKAIGMGRVIGDGGLFFQIVDIVVEPTWQGKGIGKAIVGGLVNYLRETLPKSAYVSLIADGEAWRLYAQYGFVHTAPKSVGMAFVI